MYLSELYPRQFSYYNGCRTYNGGFYSSSCRSPWDRYGRWVLAGILVFLGIVFLFVALCCASRRRRRRRRRLARTFPAPMASRPPTGNYSSAYSQPYYVPAPGYGYGYGGQREGVTQPGKTYQPPYK